MAARPNYIVESVHALPGSSSEYGLVFRAGDGTIHRLVGSIERKAGVTSVTFDPHDPVFSMQVGDESRSIAGVHGRPQRRPSANLSSHTNYPDL